jgi:cytochrome bd-I ubiquinol oxidase subunit X
MWYFSWILGVMLAAALGVINVLWLETEHALDAAPGEGKDPAES